MHSNYARLSIPTLPAEVLAAPVLKDLAAMYVEHAQALTDCRSTDAESETALADMARARTRSDYSEEAEARDRYDKVKNANREARAVLADVCTRVIAEVVGKRDTIRPIIAKALSSAHISAMTAVEHAKTSDRAQRDAADALRTLDVLAVAARRDVDEADLPWLTSAVSDHYEARRNVLDPSLIRRANLGLSWRDVTESVSGLPVRELMLDDALTSERVRNALAEVALRKERRTRTQGAA